MINSRLLASAVIASTLLQACSLSFSDRESSQVVNIEAEQDKLMTLESQWSDMFGAGDLDGITRLLASETVLIAPDSAPAIGIEAVRAATQAMLSAGADAPAVSWKSTAAFVAPSGDMAYDHGVATTRLPDGSATTGYYLVVWVKEHGKWKVAADMFN